MTQGFLFEDLSIYMNQTFGVLNDGLVAQADALLPGSPFVLANGFSHLSPAFYDGLHCSIHPTKMFEALAYLATTKLPGRGERL